MFSFASQFIENLLYSVNTFFVGPCQKSSNHPFLGFSWASIADDSNEKEAKNVLGRVDKMRLGKTTLLMESSISLSGAQQQGTVPLSTSAVETRDHHDKN